MSALFTVRCRLAWNGDNFGNEWRCGFVVMPDEPAFADERPGYAVYEDDGAGNGDLVHRCESLPEAFGVAAGYARRLDEQLPIWVRSEPSGSLMPFLQAVQS